ncbi:MAG: acyl-CoA dehydrogenase [Deltaproteobacteria bacterium]|nr:acyl-CoA dehydrogenase [Deltaproteobacteria bacterium]
MSPEEQAKLIEDARVFLEERVMPLEARFGAEGFAGIEADLESLRGELRERGLWAPQMPKTLGGMELSFLDHARLSRELGKSPLGHYVFGCPAPDAGNMELLLEFGSEAQQKEFLEPLARGDVRSCFSMTEPDRAGSNPAWMETTARLEDGEWVINGRKWFTTSADGAGFAIVMAVTDPDASTYARASMILVSTDAPGFIHDRLIPVMGHTGSGWASHSEIVYDNCRVPEANLLGPRGGGFLLAQSRLGPGRIHHAMRWCGIAERAFDLMCKRAVEREVAPGRPLGTRQAVQHFIAECRAKIDAAILYVEHAARSIDERGASASRTEIACVKFFVADVLSEVLDRAIQVHGALGVTDDTPLAAFYRHERAAHIYDGADEVHKTAVARWILREYGLELNAQSK